MIYTLRPVTGIFSLLLSSTIAQQSCYWPDGTGVNQSMEEYINCYSDRDSHCCQKEDGCVSNGLCYGSLIGMTYRGSCTVKDWSNTTACPNQYCNDLVPDRGAILWMCPHPPVSWWCGDYNKVTPCQTTTQGAQSFFSYTSGRILGLPPIAVGPPTQAITGTSSPSTTIDELTGFFTTAPTISALSSTQANGETSSPATAVNASTSSINSAAAPARSASTPPSPTAATSAAITVPPDKPPQAANLGTAIGAGIGVPLSFVAMGFLGFLFWRERRRNNRGDNRKVGQEKVISGDRTGAELDGRARSMEMPDSQIPRELDHRAVKVELDGA